MEESTKEFASVEEAMELLHNGKITLNEMRVAFGLKTINYPDADKLLIVKRD